MGPGQDLLVIGGHGLRPPGEQMPLGVRDDDRERADGIRNRHRGNRFALTYVGFAASFVLAVLAPLGGPTRLLLYVTALAAACPAWLMWAQQRV
ncbi:hypothetical protein KO481_36840 [Nocardia sp. NEAU-G5]|uniref:Uncharacterized protein n=1 Tax=Nocardia albiluteola TaxID=2842303 RepID=A0ABS6BCD7_9NOCA|nr:hypothetical protein [Nocardia albiluteola]MBU3067075.1 hypothetical protein [Nocardia albiluteola]